MGAATHIGAARVRWPVTCAFSFTGQANVRLPNFVDRSRGRSALTMMDFGTSLPIDPALPELTAALRTRPAAVLVAPPGAGKTTRVPLVLAGEAWSGGRRIIVLEPRRLAARAAAARMAATLGEPVGA